MSLSDLLSLLFGFLFPAKKDLVLGIRWKDGWLVTFDPGSGIIKEWHTRLPQESFRGLTYDPVHNMLYALAQGSKNLYSIDPLSLNVHKIGKVDVGEPGGDVSSLAYNPQSGLLYLAAVNVPGAGAQKSQLFRVDPATAAATLIGDISVTFLNSISFNPDDGQIYAYALNAPPGDSGAWDSPLKSRLVRIDPATAAMIEVFQTPYHTIMGLAKLNNKNMYYTWVNWTQHYYALVDVATAQVTLLANSDSVGVTSDAMICRDFRVVRRAKPRDID